MAKAGCFGKRLDLVIYVELPKRRQTPLAITDGTSDGIDPPFYYCVSPISTSARPNHKGYRYDPARHLRALRRAGFLIMPAVWDGLSAKLTWQAGYKTAFLSGPALCG